MDKIIEIKTCIQCSQSFDIIQGDLNFYDKISPVFSGKKYQIPSPTLCPECRQQRRLARINELQLYKRSCDGCGTDMVSRFHEKTEFKNYCNKCWSSDAWSALDYGRDIDFTRSFFAQLSELQKLVPFQNLIGSLSNIENNAVYTNHTADIHNSYMVSESDFVEECYYGRLLRKSQYLVDCLGCSNSEYCYECIDSDSLYNCQYVYHSNNCMESTYLENCRNCSNCFACSGLENKKFHIYNIAYTEAEYYKKIEGIDEKEVQDFLTQERSKSSAIIGSEDCQGTMIVNSKNCYNSHDVVSCQDCNYCDEVNYSEDLMDVSSYGSNSRLMYEGVGVGRYSHNVLFCSTIGRGENLLYCIDTKKSQDCFGCVNLKGARYCILNKQYSQEEYESLVPKIIELMKRHREWGEFFPLSLSPFGYNETLASEKFPLPEEEVLSKEGVWSYYSPAFPRVDKLISATKLPSNIDEVPDDILSWAIECKDSKKPFRIIGKELEFYRKHKIAIPKKHPDQRRKQRMKKRELLYTHS